MSRKLIALYRKYRKMGYRADNAVYSARVTIKWEKAEDAGKVKLDVVPDENTTLDDLLGDCELSKRERQHFADKVDRDGVWGIVGLLKCRKCGEWKPADSVYGFVGDDWRNSGYDIDIMAETLRQAGYKI